jgi:hypothetical protein
MLSSSRFAIAAGLQKDMRNEAQRTPGQSLSLSISLVWAALEKAGRDNSRRGRGKTMAESRRVRRGVEPAIVTTREFLIQRIRRVQLAAL